MNELLDQIGIFDKLWYHMARITVSHVCYQNSIPHIFVQMMSSSGDMLRHMAVQNVIYELRQILGRYLMHSQMDYYRDFSYGVPVNRSSVCD